MSSKTRLQLPTLEQLAQLPVGHRETIPRDYIDELGHMNVSWYFTLYGRAAMATIGALGMTREYIREARRGNFVLRQVINYYAEVVEGDTVCIRSRILGRSEKRLHKMYFMVNETRCNLASTSEILGTSADLERRLSTPWEEPLRSRIDARVAESDALDWAAPVSGAIVLARG